MEKNVIWHEMYQTRFWASYMELYIYKKRRLKFFFSATITSISALGIFLNSLWGQKPWISFVSFSLLFILQIIDFFKVPCLISENELAKLCRISWLSTHASYKLEKLWLNILSCPDDCTIKDAFFEIRNNEIIEIKSLSDDIFMKYDDPKLVSMAEQETDNYFETVYKSGNHDKE